MPTVPALRFGGGRAKTAKGVFSLLAGAAVMIVWGCDRPRTTVAAALGLARQAAPLVVTLSLILLAAAICAPTSGELRLC